MSNEEIINSLNAHATLLDSVQEPYLGYVHRSRTAAVIREAIARLRTHQDNQPNEPLTLEDLRGMHEPVWVSVPRLKNGGYWCLCNGGTIIPPSCQEFDARDVKDWVFYRRPPKEER